MACGTSVEVKGAYVDVEVIGLKMESGGEEKEEDMVYG